MHRLTVGSQHLANSCRRSPHERAPKLPVCAERVDADEDAVQLSAAAYVVAVVAGKLTGAEVHVAYQEEAAAATTSAVSPPVSPQPHHRGRHCLVAALPALV